MRRAAPLVLALAFAVPARGAPVTVDIDGAPQQVEVGPGGVLRIGTQIVAIPAIPHATVTAGQVRGQPVIVVSGDEQAVVVAHTAAGWKELLRAPIGGVGLDQDYSIAIGATAAGLVRYQGRAGYHRCDGKPAYLFAEGFDGASFRRLAKIPTGLPDAAPVIAAHADPTPVTAPLLYQARVASHEPGAANAGALGIPTELDDGTPATYWHEEFSASDGEGQFFTFEPRLPSAKAAQLRVIAAGKTFNRPRRLGIVAAQGAWHVDLPDAANDPPGTAYVADFPAPVDGCVTVVIESTYGPAKGTTAIAELEVYGEGERSGGGDAALARAIALGVDGNAAAQALARRGAAGVAAIEAELARATDDAARVRLVRGAIANRDGSAGPLLARAVAEGWVHDRDLLDVIAALTALQQNPALRELAMKKDLAVDVRVAAAHGITAQADLIELAGKGPREVRHAVIDQLIRVPIDALVAAAQAAQVPSTAGDLWRAVTRRAHANADERTAALAAMTAALPRVADYDRRYRLVDGIATIGDEAALGALAALFRQLPDSPPRAAFEQIAALAIAANPRPAALALISNLARDPDAGVRMAAVGALGAQGEGEAIDHALAASLATDGWPEVRRRAAQTLGARCTRPGPARALTDAVARDPDLGVRGDALAALVECNAAGTGELLAHTWDDSNAPLELRERAVDLAAALGDRAVAAKLVQKLAAWRGAAISSTEALALAQNAAYAIGRLAPPGAAEALLDALDDSAFPEIVAAAATGLGLLGPACPASAHGKLRSLIHADDQQIVLAAQHAAAQCGK